MAGDGKLVESGAFRVDRSRALDKLMRFQLPEVRMYPLPWVQAAVAGQASAVHVLTQPAGLEFSFDGLPWSRRDLADPYRHLFDEDPDGSHTRYRELAIGILTALRVPPLHLTATFVDEGKEWVLHVKDVTTETLGEGELKDRPAPAMRLFVAARTAFTREREFLERYARHCPIPIEFGRTRIVAAPSAPSILEASFEEAGVSGRLVLPQWAPESSRIELITHGVTVAEEWLRLPGVQVEGWVRNDGFRKTLSQMGVVKDSYYLQATGALAVHSVRMLKEVAARVAARADEVGRALVAPDARAHWMPWDRSGLAERLGGLLQGSAASGPEALAVAEHSALVAALRAACLHRRNDVVADKSKDGLHAVLADAPVLFDTQGRPLSLRPLLAQARWLGHVPTLDGEPRPSGALTAAWVVREADRRFLEGFFPTNVRALKEDALGPDAAGRPVLDDPNLIVKLPFMAGKVSGEAGLSLSPHPRRSRLRWLGERGPLGASAWELRGLRLEAVLHHPELDATPREESPSEESRAAVSAVYQAAPALYQLLAREYVPEEESPRMAVVREHLMDLVRLACDARTLETPAVPWLARLPLMLDRQGRRVSLEDLKRRSKDGRKTPLKGSIHPDRFQPLVAGYPDHVRMLFANSEHVEVGAAPVAPLPPAKPDAALRPPKTARLEPRPSLPAAPPLSAPAAEPVFPRPARPEPAAEPPPDLVLDPASELRRVLSELKRRGACQIPDPAVRSLRFVESSGARFLRFHPDAAWELDVRAPAAAAVAALPPGHAVYYLASLTHSGLNRGLSGLTDAQDAVFTEALARLALERHGA